MKRLQRTHDNNNPGGGKPPEYTEGRTKMTKTADGRKVYRLASWQRNQHKFDYWYTKAVNARYDAWESNEGIEEAEERVEKMLKYYDIFNNYVDRNGIACAPYPEYNEMKEMIVAYDLRH